MANRESLLNSGTGNAPISVSGPQSGQRTVAAVVRLLDGKPQILGCPDDPDITSYYGSSYRLSTLPLSRRGQRGSPKANGQQTVRWYLAMEVTAWGTTGTHNGLKEPYRASY
ncbi:uncharacterized protein B0T23DRAFT_392334 [Neurospora hispaniola]|uniref:Uncharacterized protein n=1 Tax=Neurospora hispaniola TaxID=588809 RepID=A0AAJ0IG34_9PEZI|nr:hypothetical protein B0T23DRAFT_392334 [Neurospora hispaniola]